ncbi:MAG: hypothetical protein LDLANPLL_01509 [Turneriella sp.]|nr:hypothetical protein [Turneriella sp.]
MPSLFSSFTKIFSRNKKRHNTADGLFTKDNHPKKLDAPLTSKEFLSIYQTMPESARIQLFSSLNNSQKQRLLNLLTPSNSLPKNELGEEPKWQAEDYLPDKDERRVARLRQVKELKDLNELFTSFEAFTPDALADILSGENPNVAAAALLQFSKNFAAKVIRQIPELTRAPVLKAMATERHIVSEALLALGKKIEKLLAQRPQKQAETKIDGVKHINEILKLMGVDEASRITRELSEVDSTLATQLEKDRYTFEDLVDLNSRDFRTVFSAIPDAEIWAHALKAFDQGKRKSLLGKLPVKRAAAIAEKMGEQPKTRLETIDKARHKILQEALRLAAEREIRFAGNGLH